MTETAPPPTADVSTAKYIPPARRRMMEEERKRLETMGPSPPQYDGMIQREICCPPTFAPKLYVACIPLLLYR